jgi:hypothetical protein
MVESCRSLRKFLALFTWTQHLSKDIFHHEGREAHEDRIRERASNLKKMLSSFVLFVCSFENMERRGLGQFQ